MLVRDVINIINIFEPEVLLFKMQAKSKAEEAAPGVTTGMILSLRERCFRYS